MHITDQIAVTKLVINNRNVCEAEVQELIFDHLSPDKILEVRKAICKHFNAINNELAELD